MWRWWLLLLLVRSQSLSHPIDESSTASTIDKENVRTTRQLDFGECCPCPKSSDGGVGPSDEVLDALPSSVSSATVLPDDSDPRSVLPGGDARVGGCPCQLRDAQPAAATARHAPSQVSASRNYIAQSGDELKPLLHPEVDLASSVLETLRDATEEEYQDALARDAQRSMARDAEGKPNNIVTIIVAPINSDEDDALTQATHVQESRCIHSPLGSIQNAKSRRPTPGLLREILGMPKTPAKTKLFDDSNFSPSEVREEIVPMEPVEVRESDLDSSLAPSNIDETVVENTSQQRNAPEENIETESPLSSKDSMPLDKSSITDNLNKLKNIKDIVGEREIKLKVPYLKVRGFNKNEDITRSSGIKLPTLSELLNDIISPKPEKKSDIEKPNDSEDVNNNVEEITDDDDDGQKFKTRILDTLPSPSQVNAEVIPQPEPSSDLPVQPSNTELKDEDDGDFDSSVDAEAFDEPEPAGTVSNPVFESFESNFAEKEASTEEDLFSVENNVDLTNNNLTVNNNIPTNARSDKKAILENLNKLGKISNDLEKIKDLVEDMSKNKKDVDFRADASARNENVTASKTNSTDITQRDSDDMTGAGSESKPTISLPKLSAITTDPLNFLNSVFSPNRVVQPSLLERSRFLPLDLNSLSLKDRAVPQLPSVDEIRERISDFLGKTGLALRGSNDDLDDDSNTNFPVLSLSKLNKQPTELVDLDLFRYRPLKSPPNTLRSNQPIQGFNLEKFKAKLQVPAKSVKPVKLQSTYGQDGGLLGGTFSLQPPNEAFWDKVRGAASANTPTVLGQPLSAKQPSINDLRSELRSRADSILGSVKSNKPVPFSPLLGGPRSVDQVPSPLLPNLQKTSSSIINVANQRANDVLGAINDGKNSIPDSIARHKTVLEDKLNVMRSNIEKNVNEAKENLLGTVNNLSASRSIGNRPLPQSNANNYPLKSVQPVQATRPNQINLKNHAGKSSQTRPKTRTNINNGSIQQGQSKKPVNKKLRQKAKDAIFAPSEQIVTKSIPDRLPLKNLRLKTNDNVATQPKITSQNPIAKSNPENENHRSKTKLKSTSPLLRISLLNENMDAPDPVEPTIPSIPKLRTNKINYSKQQNHDHIGNIKPLSLGRSIDNVAPENIKGDSTNEQKDMNLSEISLLEKIQSRLSDIDSTARQILEKSKSTQHSTMKSSQPTIDTSVLDKLSANIQARLENIDLNAKKILQNNNDARTKDLDHSATENQQILRTAEPNEEKSAQNKSLKDNISLKTLVEKIQSRLSEADAAVRKSLDNAKPQTKEVFKSNDAKLNDMSEGASENQETTYDQGRKPLSKLLKNSLNPKNAEQNTNEPIKTRVPSSTDTSKSVASDRNTETATTQDLNPQPKLVKLTERLQSRLSEADAAIKSLLQRPVIVTQPKTDNNENIKDTPGNKETHKLQSSLLKQSADSKDMEQGASENDRSIIDRLVLNKLRENLQSRLSGVDNGFKNAKPSLEENIKDTNEKSVENIEKSSEALPQAVKRPLLEKLSQRLQSRLSDNNEGIKRILQNPDRAALEEGPQDFRDADTGIMKSLPSNNNRMRESSDMNEGASENIEASRTIESEPKKHITSPLLSKLTQRYNKLREDNNLSGASSDLIPKPSESVQAVSRNGPNKPMKQNVTYRCRMVCEEVEEDKK